MADKTKGLGLRALIADELRRIADRIDRPGAPKATHLSFTFEERTGIAIRDDGRGCRLWYLNDAEHERAHDEAGPVAGGNATVWLPQRAAKGTALTGRHDAPVDPQFRDQVAAFMNRNDGLLRRLADG